jgi:trans-aconitate methyltransferase
VSVERSYARYARTRTPNALLIEALSNLDCTDGTALDIGAGSLTSSRHLLSAGFTVHAVDTDPYTTELAAELDDPQLTIHCVDIRDFPIPERQFDLIAAIHVLHLLPHRDLETVMPRLVHGLADGGLLCATFVGVRDTWAATPWRATALRRDELGELISDLGVIRLDEREYDGVNVLGQRKHWHTLRCLLRK